MRALWIQAAAVSEPADVDTILARAKQGGLDTLFYHVPASYAPRGFDSLGALVEGAHARGLRVYAWFCFGADPYIVARWPIPEKNFTDFSQNAAREAMAGAVAGLVASYEIDGIALDYMRHATLVDESTPRYTSEDVTAAVAAIREAASTCEVVASVKAYKRDWTRWAQDWPGWLAEGLIDRAVLMSYHPLDGYDDHIRAILDELSARTIAPERLIPSFCIIETRVEGEPLKLLVTLEAEIAFFAGCGFTGSFTVFDQRATADQLALLCAASPPSGTAPDAIEGITEQLRAIVSNVLKLADELKSTMFSLSEASQAAADTSGRIQTQVEVLKDMSGRLAAVDTLVEQAGREL